MADYNALKEQDQMVNERDKKIEEKNKILEANSCTIKKQEQLIDKQKQEQGSFYQDRSQIRMRHFAPVHGRDFPAHLLLYGCVQFLHLF